MPSHLTLAELNEGLPEILQSPQDNGTLARIVIRPEKGAAPRAGQLRAEPGAGHPRRPLGQGCWQTTDDGSPHPDTQICIMNARCIALIAQERGNWAPAGDNLFIDLDLSPDNTPRARGWRSAPRCSRSPPRRIMAAKVHPRYGRDACVFVNTGEGKRLRLRGIYGRVVQDGRVSVGDVVSKHVAVTSTQDINDGEAAPPQMRPLEMAIGTQLQRR